MAIVLENRVTNLEELMAQLLTTVDRVDRQIERTQRHVDQLSAEMGEFKDEMGEFKDEMGEFKDEMGGFKDEMSEFKIHMNRQWGELANKMGSMAEDLVAPSVGRILCKVVDCPEDRIESVAVRVRRLHPVTRNMQEFDVVAACGQYVLINETKSRLNPEGVKDFAELLPTAHHFFPEYADRKIIGAIASLYVDDSLVRYSERLGLVVLGFGEDVMDVLNSPGFAPKIF